MQRFSTAEFTIFMPFNAETLAAMVLTFKQNGRNVIEKAKDELTVSGSQIYVMLTQDETGQFEEGEFSMQIHFLTPEGKSGHTRPVKLYVEDVQHEEAL